LNFGDNSTTDLGENETDTAPNNPWLEFSANIAFSKLENAQYLTLAPSGVLTQERVFSPLDGLEVSDGGANGNYTARVDELLKSANASSASALFERRWTSDNRGVLLAGDPAARWALTDDLTMANPAAPTGVTNTPDSTLDSTLTENGGYTVHVFWRNVSGDTLASSASNTVTLTDATNEYIEIQTADVGTIPATAEKICVHTVSPTAVHRRARLTFDGITACSDSIVVPGCCDVAPFITAGEINVWATAGVTPTDPVSNTTTSFVVAKFTGDNGIEMLSSYTLSINANNAATATINRTTLGVATGGLTVSKDGGATKGYALIPDGAVTFVVDKLGRGQFTTIQAAINQVITNADASATKTYRILVIPAPTAYAEDLNLSGLNWTSIESVGGRANVQSASGGTAANPSRNVVLRNLKFSAGVCGGGAPPCAPTGDANYDLELDNVEAAGVNAWLTDTAGQRPRLFVHNSRFHSPAGVVSTAAWDFGSHPDNTSAPHYGDITFVANLFEVDLQDSDTGAVNIHWSGQAPDSTINFIGNKFIIYDCTSPVPGDDEGCTLMGGKDGQGGQFWLGNEIEFNMTTGCVNSTCGHAGWMSDTDHGNGTETVSRHVLIGNRFTFNVKAAGFSLDHFDFVSPANRDASQPTTVKSMEYYLAGNEFRVVNSGAGDAAIPANVRDVFLQANTVASVKIYLGQQNLRYGVEKDGGSLATVEAMATLTPSDTALSARGAMRIPASGAGLFWFDTAERRVPLSDLSGNPLIEVTDLTQGNCIQGQIKLDVAGPTVELCVCQSTNNWSCFDRATVNGPKD